MRLREEPSKKEKQVLLDFNVGKKLFPPGPPRGIRREPLQLARDRQTGRNKWLWKKLKAAHVLKCCRYAFDWSNVDNGVIHDGEGKSLAKRITTDEPQPRSRRHDKFVANEAALEKLRPDQLMIGTELDEEERVARTREGQRHPVPHHYMDENSEEIVDDI
ncbi:hypothetical protein INS49_009174 [Diaporthe citri]|uniref:uncharacterized protein n=1 Tax=Diaporthe citri TaxID=83186 RepID=UPI001C7F4BBF|nr:uncharacterized protein INS49_009174 [Diaporthe citri]KAG6364071.1 hypothetical protein INS49_009174 [Diaporthe citri]